MAELRKKIEIFKSQMVLVDMYEGDDGSGCATFQAHVARHETRTAMRDVVAALLGIKKSV